MQELGNRGARRACARVPRDLCFCSAVHQGTAAVLQRPERLIGRNRRQDLEVVVRICGFRGRLHLFKIHVAHDPTVLAQPAVLGHEVVVADGVLTSIPRLTATRLKGLWIRPVPNGDKRQQCIELLPCLFALTACAVAVPTAARNTNGRWNYLAADMREWFKGLHAQRTGILCCDEADGWRVDDVDWESKDGHYRVRLYGEWVPVPDETVVTEPNRFGPAVVWPYLDTDGTTQVRCFLPGAGG